MIWLIVDGHRHHNFLIARQEVFVEDCFQQNLIKKKNKLAIMQPAGIDEVYLRKVNFNRLQQRFHFKQFSLQEK